MSYTITINGLNEAIAKLDRIRVTEILEPAMRRAVLRVERRMKEYPQAPATSRYIRSGTLGRRWATQVIRSGNTLTGKIGNATWYGPWVQSERFQARFHRRTGWPTDEQVMREEEAAIRADFERALKEALR